MAQTVKKPLAIWKTWVRSLDWEDPLVEGMATHSSILENPMDSGAWWATDHGLTKRQTQLSSQAQYSTHAVRKDMCVCVNVSVYDIFKGQYI